MVARREQNAQEKKEEGKWPPFSTLNRANIYNGHIKFDFLIYI